MNMLSYSAVYSTLKDVKVVSSVKPPKKRARKAEKEAMKSATFLLKVNLLNKYLNRLDNKFNKFFISQK